MLGRVVSCGVSHDRRDEYNETSVEYDAKGVEFDEMPRITPLGTRSWNRSTMSPELYLKL